jgi:HAD superfamily hydrolase (TIGR01509 family)
MTRLKALLWDVDGTLAETERDGHRVAFNRAFEDCGVPWRWDEAHYGDLLRITGGRERFLFDMNTRANAPPLAEREALARAVHEKKKGHYAELVKSAGIVLRGGVRELMNDCRERGVRMGVATTSSRVNVEALLRKNLGERWADAFAVMVCGEDVERKKPDPEVYALALSRLGIGPLDAVAIEDAPGGVAAARAADIPVVVTRSSYFAMAPIDGAVAVGPGLHTRRGWRPGLSAAGDETRRVDLDDIEGWCAQMDTITDHP